MMVDEKEGAGSSLYGNDWEVVSLTASMYAAAPGPKECIPYDGGKDEDLNENDRETHAAMFMSQHFAFPPNHSENLPIESECSEIPNDSGGEDGRPAEDYKDGALKNWKTKSNDSIHGIEFFDQGKSLPIHDMEFRDGKALQELELVREQVLYDAAGFGVLTSQRTNDVETIDHSRQDTDTSSDSPSASKMIEEKKCVGFGLPCEAWWKRQAAYLYNHIKETNTIWSLIVSAAALIGFAFLGWQWQQGKLQLQQLKWQFSTCEGKMNGMLGLSAQVAVGDQHTPISLDAVTSGR